MNAVVYTRKLRRLGLISMVTVCGAAGCLAAWGIIPDGSSVPYWAVLLGFVPVLLFMDRQRPVCEKCQGLMKFKAGFPTIVFQCRDCGDLVDTGVHPIF